MPTFCSYFRSRERDPDKVANIDKILEKFTPQKMVDMFTKKYGEVSIILQQERSDIATDDFFLQSPNFAGSDNNPVAEECPGAKAPKPTLAPDSRAPPTQSQNASNGTHMATSAVNKSISDQIAQAEAAKKPVVNDGSEVSFSGFITTPNFDFRRISVL